MQGCDYLFLSSFDTSVHQFIIQLQVVQCGGYWLTHFCFSRSVCTIIMHRGANFTRCNSYLVFTSPSHFAVLGVYLQCQCNKEECLHVPISVMACNTTVGFCSVYTCPHQFQVPFIMIIISSCHGLFYYYYFKNY